MTVTQPPVVVQYRRALDEFRRAGERSPLLERMSELISLLDLTTALDSGLSRDEILDAALLVVMGEMQTTRGCVLVRSGGDAYDVVAARGLDAGAPARIEIGSLVGAVVDGDGVILRGDAIHGSALAALGLEALCPVVGRDHTRGGATASPVALLGLGPRAGGRPYGAEQSGYLLIAAAAAAAPIENSLIHDELRKVNQRLSVKVFQLHGLFDISRELTASFDEESITNLVTSTLMGHLMVSRCALYLPVAGGLGCVHERGLRTEGEPPVFPPADAARVLDVLQKPAAVADLPPGPIRQRLLATRMALAVPLGLGTQTEGLLAIGERLSGTPFTEEDGEFAHTLGRQATAALETVRLHRISLEKQRRDREMQLARDIQRSLFPQSWAPIEGFEIAAENRSYFEVGGDHYDVIPLEGGRVALAIADVSGKGTPASILMASVHASLRALAGTSSLPVLMTRLNRFLYDNTEANRFVTLFYGELDAPRRRFAYVNAGHVPPFHVRAGAVDRLQAGGPVLGLLDDAGFESAEVLLEPGDVLAMVTDGATEALSPDEEEFGDERVVAALATSHRAPAARALSHLLTTVEAWTGAVGCTDDLTALLLKAL
jgi:sigma-B regulation protein RsbU (phosphoserine phosphatase)